MVRIIGGEHPSQGREDKACELDEGKPFVELDDELRLQGVPSRIFIFSFNALSSIFIVGTNLSKTLKGIPMLLGTFILFNASSISFTLTVFVIYPPNIAIKVILDVK